MDEPTPPLLPPEVEEFIIAELSEALVEMYLRSLPPLKKRLSRISEPTYVEWHEEGGQPIFGGDDPTKQARQAVLKQWAAMKATVRRS